MPKELRKILRIAGTNVDGTKKLVYALTEIKGAGIRLANVIVEKASLDPDTRLGFLSDGEVERIESIIENPSKNGIPNWLLNRQKDRETGNDLHLTGSDLVLQTKTDIDQLKEMTSWRGFRHAHGLKVRGQKTRTTGRTKKAVGVKKKKIIAERRRL